MYYILSTTMYAGRFQRNDPLINHVGHLLQGSSARGDERKKGKPFLRRPEWLTATTLTLSSNAVIYTISLFHLLSEQYDSLHNTSTKGCFTYSFRLSFLITHFLISKTIYLTNRFWQISASFLLLKTLNSITHKTVNVYYTRVPLESITYIHLVLTSLYPSMLTTVRHEGFHLPVLS